MLTEDMSYLTVENTQAAEVYETHADIPNVIRCREAPEISPLHFWDPHRMAL